MSYVPLRNEPSDDENHSADSRASPPSLPTFRQPARFWQRDFWLDALAESRRRRPKSWLGREPAEDGTNRRFSSRQVAAGGAVLLLLALLTWGGKRSGHRRELTVEGSTWSYPGRPVELLRHHEGETFLDGFNFFDEPDPTHGTVVYQNATSATTSKLAYTSPNGTTILTIDRVSTLEFEEPRKSVRIHSKATVSTGSLIIMDMSHAPVGCSVWPSFWMYGPFWPHSGEIDVYEGVNYRGNNLFSLHTSKGCVRKAVEQIGDMTGSADCNADPKTGGDYNGCSTMDKEGTLGSRFNEGGGGVFATMIAEEGIFIWRWRRDLIPADVNLRKPTPATWGLPVASWLSDACDIPTYFRNLNLVFDITTCGDWAGTPGVWTAYRNRRCGAVYPTCNHAVEDPSNFNDAYFDINYLSVYKL